MKDDDKWRHGGLPLCDSLRLSRRRVVRAVSPGSAGAFVFRSADNSNRTIVPMSPPPMDHGNGTAQGYRFSTHPAGKGSRGGRDRPPFSLPTPLVSPLGRLCSFQVRNSPLPRLPHPGGFQAPHGSTRSSTTAIGLWPRRDGNRVRLFTRKGLRLGAASILG